MSLSPSEKELVLEIDFKEEILEMIKKEFQEVEFEKLFLEKEVFLESTDNLQDFLPKYYCDYLGDNRAGVVSINGLSVTVPYLKLKHLQKTKKKLSQKGYLVSSWKTIVTFLGSLVAIVFPEPFKHTIEVFKAEDPFDILRIKQTHAWKYNLSNKDIINRLKSWQNYCEFEILAAHNKGVALEFIKLPKNLNGFAREIYEFCPSFSDLNEIVKTLKQYHLLSLSWF